MNILIINTAFENANYIVVKGDEIFSKTAGSSAKHSETSLVFIDKLLDDAGLSIADIDVVAVNVGPGSFTGIRIGVALAKGFMSARSELLGIGFTSFEPLFKRLNGGVGKVCIFSGKADYYVCEIGKGGEFNYLVEDENSINNCVGSVVFDGEYTTYELVDCVKRKIENSEFSAVSELEPLYMKLCQAEMELKSKGNNGGNG